MRVGPLIPVVSLILFSAGGHAAGPPDDFDVSGEVASAGSSPSVGTHRITVTGRGTGSEDVCHTGTWGPFHSQSCNPSGAESDARESAEGEARDDARDKCRAKDGSVVREHDPATSCSFNGRTFQCRSTVRVRCEVPDSQPSAHGGSVPHSIGEPALTSGGGLPQEALSARD